VAEALAVVVLAAREVVAEGLLVEVRVERRRRGRVAPDGGGRAALTPHAPARAGGGRRRGEQRGAERRGDGRHRHLSVAESSTRGRGQRQQQTDPLLLSLAPPGLCPPVPLPWWNARDDAGRW
jgi:hypothetical protein